MKILLVHPDFDQASLIATQCQMEIDAEFIIQRSASAAKIIYDLTPDCSAIILYDPENPKDSSHLINVARKNDPNIHIVHFSTQDSDDTVTFKDDLEYLIEMILQKLELDKNNNQYKRVHLEYLQYFKEIPVEISLLINEKYVKVLNRGDKLTNDFIEKYNDKKVKYVYISQLDKASFIKHLTAKFQDTLNKSLGPLDTKQVHESVFKLLVDFGFEPEVTRLAQETTESILQKIEENEQLQDLIKELYKKKASFRYKYNYMTSIIAHSLVSDSQNSWVTDQHKQAVVYAAILNDSFLDEDRLVQLRDTESLDNLKLSSKEKEHVLKHALLTTQQYQECERILPETLKIIMQHHGTLNGLGFNKDLDGVTALHPLTYFFIVAEEFSLKILTDPSKKVNVPRIVKNIQLDYSNNKIDQVINILKKHLNIR